MVLATCQADGKAEAIELSNGCLIFNALEAIEQRKEKLIASEKKSKAKKLQKKFKQKNCEFKKVKIYCSRGWENNYGYLIKNFRNGRV